MERPLRICFVAYRGNMRCGGQGVYLWFLARELARLGHEIDVYAVFRPWKALFVQPGYGVFIPAGAGKTLGGDDPQHFLWLWITVNF